MIKHSPKILASEEKATMLSAYSGFCLRYNFIKGIDFFCVDLTAASKYIYT